jgi:hypothetical protein
MIGETDMARYLPLLLVLIGACCLVDDVRGQVEGSRGGTSSTPASLNSDPHLVAWWKLDETSGTTATDSSKKGHHATLRGGLHFDSASVPGRLGRAIQLSGKDDFLEVTGYKGVRGTQPRTVAVWVKTKRNRGEIIAWGEDDGGKMWMLKFIRGYVGISPEGGYYYTGERIDDERWRHVAVVVTAGDPPNLHDNVRIYVDGTVAKVHDIGLLDLWPVETGDEIDVRIGRGFEGGVDDLRIYDRALSADEVKALSTLKEG